MPARKVSTAVKPGHAKVERATTSASPGKAAPSTEETVIQPIQAVVGMVASAGGLEAFKQFFQAMPSHSGLAFVLIPHLDPKHESLMAPLLGKQTAMPVAEAEDGQRLEADHVYVIPPNNYLTLHKGTCLYRQAGPLGQAVLEHAKFHKDIYLILVDSMKNWGAGAPLRALTQPVGTLGGVVAS